MQRFSSLQRIAKALGVILIGTFLIIALCGITQNHPKSDSAQLAAEGSTARAIDTDTLAQQLLDAYPASSTTKKAPSMSCVCAPMHLYQLDDGTLNEVDCLTDDFERIPERWLYVLEPGRDYVAVVKCKHFGPEPLTNGCFIFSNSIPDGKIGSISLISYAAGSAKNGSAHDKTTYAQVKFLASGDLTLHHGDPDQLLGRANCTSDELCIWFTCQAGLLQDRKVLEETIYAALSPSDSMRLEVYGAPVGTSSPYEDDPGYDAFDANTYLYPSDHLSQAFLDVQKQIEHTMSCVLHQTSHASISYGLGEIKLP